MAGCWEHFVLLMASASLVAPFDSERMLFVEVADGECQMVPHFGGELLCDVLPDDVSVCDSENEGNVLPVEDYVSLLRFADSMRELGCAPEVSLDGADDALHVVSEEMPEEVAREIWMASCEQFVFSSAVSTAIGLSIG